MTSIEQILSSVQSTVDKFWIIAVIWHVLFYSLIVALLLKWSPPKKLSGILLCLPLLSVSVFSWIAGNPFNGSVFILVAILIFIFSLRTPVGFSKSPSLIFFVSGILMVGFGLVYPHFVQPGLIHRYLYASPAGLIPCPTLSVLIGLALIFNGFGSKSISLTLIILGLFYGIFGVLKLSVYIDLFLLFGALMYLTNYVLSIRGTKTT